MLSIVLSASSIPEYLSKSYCVNLSFQLLVTFTPLMKSVHLLLGHNPQLGLALKGPLAVSCMTSQSSSANIFIHSIYVGSLCKSSV
jgi:hypothetical protein